MDSTSVPQLFISLKISPKKDSDDKEKKMYYKRVPPQVKTKPSARIVEVIHVKL